MNHILKAFHLCLLALLLASCATEDDLLREKRLEGVKLPPETAIDCYNILAAYNEVAGKITIENDLPVIKFYDCSSFVSILYLPDENTVTARYTIPCADPEPLITSSVMMLVSSKKKIYAACSWSFYNSLAEESGINYYIYRSGEFIKARFDELPADIQSMLNGKGWSRD